MQNTLKLVSYNIDGLPETLDLNDLPWLLKPIAWIYKLIKKTTIVVINDNVDKSRCIGDISEYLLESDADIIGIQEDFNYHDTVAGPLRGLYHEGTYMGGFDLSKIFSSAEWWSCFPLPRFKADGLGFFSKRGLTEIEGEDIKRWKKSYGYFTHANDKLTHKGFRHYEVKVESKTLDIYVLHMDADFYNPESCPDVSGDIKARKCQLKQLVKYIIDRKNSGVDNPAIIMGDTNSGTYEWDVENINEYLLKPINSENGLSIEEVMPDNMVDVDRAFLVNNEASRCKLVSEGGHYNAEMDGKSDHRPFEFKVAIKQS